LNYENLSFTGWNIGKLGLCVNPNVADLHRGKTRQSAPDVAEHSLGQVVAYLTVCEILADASTGEDGGLWRESHLGGIFAGVGLQR